MKKNIRHCAYSSTKCRLNLDLQKTLAGYILFGIRFLRASEQLAIFA